MQVKNLKVGQVFKNYKELCQVLGLKPTTGTSKQAQFKELERYCKYHKKGHKIIIDSINTKVGVKMDKRTIGNNNDISKNLRYMILDLLSRHEPIEGVGIGFSKTLIYTHCGMINSNYRNAKGNRKQWAQSLNINDLVIEECLDYTDDRLYKTLRRACSTLCSTNKALGYRLGYNYILKGEENELDTQYTADIELEDIIRETENTVMKQMKISRYDKIYQYGRWKEFKEKVISILKSEYPLYFNDLKYYYNAVVFNYLNQTIERTKEGFEQSFKLNKTIAKANVNKYFSKSLDNTIKNRHKKVIEKHGFGQNFNIVDDYRMSETYVEEQKKTKDSIIKLKHKQLIFDIDVSFDNDDENIPF